eukprot:GILI01011055.1.p1 GENE.GILI01011055.1~~GILI01011055.1.p1  ORF type:complete len:370 (-),score=53.45 GILI01011055.1:41-1054(-)
MFLSDDGHRHHHHHEDESTATNGYVTIRQAYVSGDMSLHYDVYSSIPYLDDILPFFNDESLSSQHIPSLPLPPAPSPAPTPTPAQESYVVAVTCPTTSRGIANPSLEPSMPIVGTLLHNVAKSAGQSTGLVREVRVFVGFDEGDAFWDNERIQADCIHLFNERIKKQYNVVTPMSLTFVKCSCRNMVCSSNCLLKKAVEGGADYIYRVNDDTAMETSHWAEKFIQTLRSYNPPNIGVVGPRCDQGKTSILTHDCIHRSHWDIFGFHYPPAFENWYCDDWVSHVYGEARTRKLMDVSVFHAIFQTRYSPDYNKERGLHAEEDQARHRIEEYIKNNKLQ